MKKALRAQCGKIFEKAHEIMRKQLGFVPTWPQLQPGQKRNTCFTPRTTISQNPLAARFSRRVTQGCQPSPQRASEHDEQESEDMLLDSGTLNKILEGTMLSNRQLARAYSSRTDGFSNTAFFGRMIPLDGVPSLVVGRTETGELFGGYTSHGFAGRDDYRETTSPQGLFVFAVRDGRVIMAEQTDRVLYDFYDCAIRFGAGLLTIPMNAAKHVMKDNMGRSACVMEDGFASVFGDSSMASLEVVHVLVASEYVDEVRKGPKKGRGFLGGLFG